MAGHRRCPAGERETPQSLVLGVARERASEALGRSEAFASALAFISVALRALGTSRWRRMAMDAGAPADAAAVGSVAASLQWHARWPGHVSGLGAPLTLHHVELHRLAVVHAASVLAGGFPGDGRMVNKYIFLGTAHVCSLLEPKSAQPMQKRCRVEAQAGLKPVRAPVQVLVDLCLKEATEPAASVGEGLSRGMKWLWSVRPAGKAPGPSGCWL